jgi:hypothetical protein
MDRACSMCGEITNAYKTLVGKPQGKGHSEDLDVDGSIMLNDLMEVGFGGVDWIRLAQDGDRWRTLVNTVMKLRIA